MKHRWIKMSPSGLKISSMVLSGCPRGSPIYAQDMLYKCLSFSAERGSPFRFTRAYVDLLRMLITAASIAVGYVTDKTQTTIKKQKPIKIQDLKKYYDLHVSIADF